MTDLEATSNAEYEYGFGAYLQATWATVRDHWFPLLMASFVRDGLSILAAGLVFCLFSDLRGWNIAIALIVRWLCWSAFQGGYLRLCLNISNGEKAEFRELFSGWKYCLPMFLATTCVWLSIATGLLLLLIPGIFLAVRFSLYGLDLIDKKSGALESLTDSNQMIRGYAKYATGFLLICLGGCILTLGLLTLPFETFFVIALCKLYKHIRAQEGLR